MAFYLTKHTMYMNRLINKDQKLLHTTNLYFLFIGLR